MENKFLISIIGPTAIGKTKLAISLADDFNAEIISNDSRQFYKEMTIGTAVPNEEELNSVTHHFIQHLSIFDEYSVGEFERNAIELISKLHQFQDIVFMVGGSGLYEKAVSDGLDDFPEIALEIRANLNLEFTQNGLIPLQKELEAVDPEYFNQVDIQNPQRVIRALEIYRGSGKTFSSFRKQEKKSRDFHVIKIGLALPRELLYERINSRVEQMFSEGLFEEAKELFPHKNINALQTVGYREIFDHLDNKISLEEAKEEIKKNTRRFAKRQMTWFNRDERINWFSPDATEEISTFIQSEIDYINYSIS